MKFKAIYNDGTSFEWDENTPNEDAYKNIDRSRLAAFEVHDPNRSPTLLHRLHLEPGQRLIVRARVQQKLFTGEQKRFYLVGYQETIHGQNRQAITAIFPDGHTELLGSWKNAPLDAVNLMDAEKI